MPENYGLDVEGQDTGLRNAVLSNAEAYVNPDGYTLHLDASTASIPATHRFVELDGHG